MLNLTKGVAKSCGCLKRAPSKRRANLRVLRFGLLVAQEPITGKSWRCVCDCGGIKDTATVNLVHGKTKSCGCLTRCDDVKRAERIKVRNEIQKSGWPSAVVMDANSSCDACGAVDNLHAHHLYPVSTHPEYRLNIENGACLCKKCHWDVHRLIYKGVKPIKAYSDTLLKHNPEMKDFHEMVWRGSAEDLRKVIHYAQLALELQYGEKNK